MYDLKRLKELAERSYNTGQYTFTDFLGLPELSEFYKNEKELHFASPALFGGCEIAERKVIRFGNENELGYLVDFPIAALSVKPLQKKFADDLTHRDFLGALMNLGIKRQLLGDIFIKDNEAIIFCRDSICEYMIENLTRVKHTSVSVAVTDETGLITAPDAGEKMIQVSSARLDAIIAKTYNISRQEALSLFSSGLVFLNGMECNENAKVPKDGDLITVRGRGRFEFAGTAGLSKKGKLNCRIRLY